MNDAARAMPAFACQMPVITFQIKRHAEFGQTFDRFWRILDDKFDRGAVVKPSACYHRILDMAGKRIARLEHRRDPALSPCGCSVGKRALSENDNLPRYRQLQCSCKPGCA